VGTLVAFRVGAVDAGKLVKEILPVLDPYDLTLLPNRRFWIRPLVGGQSVEAFTGETITIKEGKHDERRSEPPEPAPVRKREPQAFEPEELGD
jgi:hypothetical protein